MLSLKKRLPALVLRAALMLLVFGTLIGCPQEEDYTPPQAGVLTVSGAEDGVFYEAEVYDYPNDDVADAADLAELISVFEMVGTGLDIPGEEALEIELLTPDGEDFTADGDFLVVLKNEKDASAPLRYKAAVPFTGGSATVEYDDMETATVEPSDPNNPNGPSVSGYTVTFHTNGGTPADFTQTVADGDKAKEPETDPTRDGHTFVGWFTDAAGTGAAWDFTLNTVTANLGLYAKWTQIFYTVTFKDGSAVLSTQTVAHGSTATRPAEDPTKDGAWAFDNWYTDNGGSTPFNFNTVITGPTEIFAGWLPTYTVTFDLNGAPGTAPAHPAVPYGGKISEPTTEPERTGWTFVGWFLDEAGTGTATAWNFDTDTVTENTILYAKWTQIFYTVTFNAAGGTPAIITQSVPYGGAATRPATNPTRTGGYGFDDWYAATDYAAKWNFDSIVTADITLYAKWKPLTFAAVIADIAIDAAVNSTSASYTLPSGNEDYTLAITPLTPANSPASVVIDGGGRVVTGSANRITIDAGVTLTLKNITFTKIPFTVSAGATLVLDTGAVITGNAGAGITVSGTSATAKGTLEMKAGASITLNGGGGVALTGTGDSFTMSGGIISGNNAERGSGVQVNGGTFTMNGGTISGNHASMGGGGVAMDGTGTFTMNGGTISGNTAGEGAGVRLEGSGVFTMNGGTISGNNGWNGGGVYTGGNFNMTGGEITNNDAGSSGGGVFVYGSTSVFTMSNGEISGNYADYGGGVSIWGAGRFNMPGGVIKNNRVEFGGAGVHVQTNCIFNMTGGEITGNSCDRLEYDIFGGGVYLAGGTLTGNPRIGNPVTSGSGSGRIYGNIPNDVL